jgi:hypothetical protein
VQNYRIRTSVFDFLVLRLVLPKGSAKDDAVLYPVSFERNGKCIENVVVLEKIM